MQLQTGILFQTAGGISYLADIFVIMNDMLFCDLSVNLTYLMTFIPDQLPPTQIIEACACMCKNV
jgi:hypothetical protein